jgi:hypothetical protein
MSEYLGESAVKREGNCRKHWLALATILNQDPTKRLANINTMDFDNSNIAEDFEFPSTFVALRGATPQRVKDCLRLFGIFLFKCDVVGYGSSMNYLSSVKGIIQVFGHSHVITSLRGKFLTGTKDFSRIMKHG